MHLPRQLPGRPAEISSVRRIPAEIANFSHRGRRRVRCLVNARYALARSALPSACAGQLPVPRGQVPVPRGQLPVPRSAQRGVSG